MLIFNRLHLPNQECRPLFHFSNRPLVSASNGGELCSYIREMTVGMRAPRYFKVDDVHLKLKLVCSVQRVRGFSMIPIASDLAKLIFKLEIAP